MLVFLFLCNVCCCPQDMKHGFPENNKNTCNGSHNNDDDDDDDDDNTNTIIIIILIIGDQIYLAFKSYSQPLPLYTSHFCVLFMCSVVSLDLFIHCSCVQCSHVDYSKRGTTANRKHIIKKNY